MTNAFYFRKPIVQDCIKFKNNCCFDQDCTFLHRYKYCYEYQNTTCRNERCQFLHCTSVEQLRYETTGIMTEHIKREVGRSIQHFNICGDFKIKTCNRLKCKLRHIKLEDLKPMTCIICTENIIVENFGAGDCGHIFCYNCALRSLYNEAGQQMKIQCAVCKCVNEYKKTMLNVLNIFPVFIIIIINYCLILNNENQFCRQL